MLDLRRRNAPVFFTENEESVKKWDMGSPFLFPHRNVGKNVLGVAGEYKQINSKERMPRKGRGKVEFLFTLTNESEG